MVVRSCTSMGVVVLYVTVIVDGVGVDMLLHDALLLAAWTRAAPVRCVHVVVVFNSSTWYIT